VKALKKPTNTENYWLEGIKEGDYGEEKKPEVDVWSNGKKGRFQMKFLINS